MQQSSSIYQNQNYQTQYLQDHKQQNDYDDQPYQQKDLNTNQLQDIIDSERRQFRQVFSQLTTQIEFEYQQSQNLIINSNQKMEENIQLQNQIKDHELKLSQMMKENQQFDLQKQQNQAQLANHHDSTNGQINKMKDVIDYGAQQYDLMESQFNQSLQKKDASHQIQIDNLQREHDFKYKNLDEKCQSNVGHSRLLENEIKVLHETILKMKLRQDEEIKEVSVKVQEEEYKKWISGLKQVENKIKAQDEQNQQIIQKLHELHKQIIDNETLNHNQYIDNQLSHQQNQIEGIDLNNQTENHGLMMNKYSIDHSVQTKKHLQIQSNFNQFQNVHQNFKDQCKIQNQKQYASFNDEIRYLQDQKDKLQRKIADLEYISQKKEKEYGTLKNEYDKIADSLQNNIHKTIYQTVQDVSQNNVQFPQQNLNDRYQSKY